MPPALSMQGSRKQLLCISGVRSFDATDGRLDRDHDKEGRVAARRKGRSTGVRASARQMAEGVPAKSHEVRPLANVTADLQEAFGWSRDYTKGVLMAWKAREAYCRAILLYPNRVKLDGSVIEDAVDD